MVAALNPYRQLVHGQSSVRTAAVAGTSGPNTGVLDDAQRMFESRSPGAARVLAFARDRAARVETPRITRFASAADERNYDPSGAYNPRAYGGNSWRNGLQRIIPDPKRRIFDKKGHIQAADNQDAMRQIAYLHQNALREQHRTASAQDDVSPEERRELIAAAVSDPEGFAILGQELAFPIKDLIDYEGWGRKVLRNRKLAQGEFFRIPKDVRAAAYLIGQDGQGIETRLFGKWITPMPFKLGSFPTVDITDIYTVQYDILDRAQDTARQEIELEEDKRVRALLERASAAINTVTTYATLGIGAFEDVRVQVEQHRLQVEKFLINRRELSDIVKTMSTQVDPVTERELILAGYIGSVLNAMIVTAAGTGVEEVIPAGTFYAVVGPEFLGEIGIRVELFSEPFNMFAQQRFVKGWAFGEIVEIALSNARGVAKGLKI